MMTLNTFLSLFVAFALGTAIGFERQWRQRTAGLRTNVLVAVGAAAFADMGLRLAGYEGRVRIIAYVVSGIGFRGAGVIVKDGAGIRGLNTAATLWCSAAVGAFAGAGLLAESVVLAAFVLSGNTLLRPLVDWVNRHPMSAQTTEAQYRVLAVGDREHVAEIRDLLEEMLARADYPVHDIDVLSEDQDQIELAAHLVPTRAEHSELDQVVTELERSPFIRSAIWSVGTEA
jgi:putative Mg2+ transporter-C (MgtC) family protein